MKIIPREKLAELFRALREQLEGLSAEEVEQLKSADSRKQLPARK